MNQRDHDAEFERIIADWDAVVPSDAGEGAVDASLDRAGPDDSEPDLDQEPYRRPRLNPPPLGPWLNGPAREAGDAADPNTSGALGLPIAPGTGHVWRGTPRPHDDDGAALAALPSDDPDGDHFVPPTQTELPSAEDDPMFWAIVVGLAGGPLLLLYIVLFDRDGSAWWVVTALTMIAVGFVLLVLRGGTERDPSDDGTRV